MHNIAGYNCATVWRRAHYTTYTRERSEKRKFCACVRTRASAECFCGVQVNSARLRRKVCAWWCMSVCLQVRECLMVRLRMGASGDHDVWRYVCVCVFYVFVYFYKLRCLFVFFFYFFVVLFSFFFFCFCSRYLFLAVFTQLFYYKHPRVRNNPKTVL